jgi:copper transport protein
VPHHTVSDAGPSRPILRRAATALLLAVALLLRAPALAEAHTVLLSSDPAAGARLVSTPSRIRLLFSEPLEPTLARITLQGGDGHGTPLVVSVDPHDVHALIAAVDSGPPGTFRVVWRVVSADGHPATGSFVYSVTGAVARPAAPPPVAQDMPVIADVPVTWGPALFDAPIVPALLRGLALGSLMALAGFLFFFGVSNRASAPDLRAPTRLASRLAVAAATLLTLHLLAWLANAMPDHELTSTSIADVLASTVGRVELWRWALGLLALWAIALARRPRFALLFAMGALAVSGASGHSAAMAPMWAIPAKSLHLLAGAAWLGGLLWLLVANLHEPAAFAFEAQRVSAVALIAVLVVTVSGVVQTWLFLASPLDLVRSAYGIAVLLKVGGLLALVVYGAHHRFRVLPGLAPDVSMFSGFRRTLRHELLIMSLVVLLGGILAYVPPPPHVEPARAALSSASRP